MAPLDVESWRVDAPTRPCAFCRQNVEGKGCTTCPRCAAVYHPDCWVSNSRRCAVYGCEPGQKPAAVHTRAVRPSLQPPPLPRSGMSWAWAMPIVAIIASNLVRAGLSSSSTPPPSPAPRVLRQASSLEESRFPSELIVPAPIQDVPALIREADGYVNSVSMLTSLPTGRLTDDVRRMLHRTVTDEVATLQKALKIYYSCAAARGDETLRSRIDRLRWLIIRKRDLLVDVTRAMGPN